MQHLVPVGVLLGRRKLSAQTEDVALLWAEIRAKEGGERRGLCQCQTSFWASNVNISSVSVSISCSDGLRRAVASREREGEEKEVCE